MVQFQEVRVARVAVDARGQAEAAVVVVAAAVEVVAVEVADRPRLRCMMALLNL